MILLIRVCFIRLKTMELEHVNLMCCNPTQLVKKNTAYISSPSYAQDLYTLIVYIYHINTSCNKKIKYHLNYNLRF